MIPSASSIVLKVGLDHQDYFKVYTWNGLRKVTFLEQFSFRSGEIEAADVTKVKIGLENASVRKIRIDPGNQAGVVKIYGMKINSHFSDPRNLQAQEIMEIFAPGKEDVSMELKENYVEIISSAADPYIISTKPLLDRNPLIFLIPFLFALLFFVFLLEFDIAGFPAFRDIFTKRPSSGANINALDGLRGLAAIMVVGHHTYGPFTGLGTTGVWIFMALSGFLLARPFIDRPELVFSVQYMSHFFLRRAQRIIPIYYFYITIVFLVTGRLTAAILHYLFLEGRAHLWVMPQEIVFYLCVPLIMGINYVLFKENIKLTIISLLIMLVCANMFLGTSVISLYGMFFDTLRLYIGVFLSGVMFSYLYYGIYCSSRFARSDSRWRGICFSILGFLILFFFLLGSSEKLWGGSRIFAQIYFPWFGFAAGLLIFSIVASGNSILAKVLSWRPLRVFSIVTLSLYLFHPLVLAVIKQASNFFLGFKLSGLYLFFTTLIVSYLLACLTYTYIERPFSGAQKKVHS
jgi:peptidoglycan/LPS O-acetylase OafA/YrhL